MSHCSFLRNFLSMTGIAPFFPGIHRRSVATNYIQALDNGFVLAKVSYDTLADSLPCSGVWSEMAHVSRPGFFNENNVFLLHFASKEFCSLLTCTSVAFFLPSK